MPSMTKPKSSAKRKLKQDENSHDFLPPGKKKPAAAIKREDSPDHDLNKQNQSAKMAVDASTSGAKAPEAEGFGSAEASDLNPPPSLKKGAADEVSLAAQPPSKKPPPGRKKSAAKSKKSSSTNTSASDSSAVAGSEAHLRDFRGGQEGWNAHLYELLLYKSRRGDLNVRHDDPDYKSLYSWVQNQRKHYKLHKNNQPSCLTKERIAVLDSIQFQWNVRGEQFWKKNFEALQAYKEEFGHCMVPRLWEKNPKLGEWVTEQRRQYKAKIEGKPTLLTADRMAKLDEVNFVWRIRARTEWSDRFHQLLEFKNEHGHTIVPQHYADNRALGKWVAKQREQFRFLKQGKHSFLTEERINLLKGIGFTWSIKGRAHREELDGAMEEGDSEELVGEADEGGGGGMTGVGGSAGGIVVEHFVGNEPSPLSNDLIGGVARSDVAGGSVLGGGLAVPTTSSVAMGAPPPVGLVGGQAYP